MTDRRKRISIDWESPNAVGFDAVQIHDDGTKRAARIFFPKVYVGDDLDGDPSVPEWLFDEKYNEREECLPEGWRLEMPPGFD